jgi:hypothetical protein
MIFTYAAVLIPQGLTAEYDAASVTPVLNSAEKFFVSLKNRNFSESWELLSEKSRKTIIEDVSESNKKIGNIISKETIKTDFNNKGSISNHYWAAFVASFDPDIVLEHSRWELGFIKKQKAEIITTYKNSKNPTVLKMYRESGSWRVGLVETFWSIKQVN